MEVATVVDGVTCIWVRDSHMDEVVEPLNFNFFTQSMHFTKDTSPTLLNLSHVEEVPDISRISLITNDCLAQEKWSTLSKRKEQQKLGRAPFNEANW